MKLVLLAAAALTLTACDAVGHAPRQVQPAVPDAAPAPPRAAACDALSSSDWAAWVNAMPGPGARPTLIVTGKIEVATGGYRVVWRDLRIMESYPVQVVAELETIRPTGYVTEAHVIHDVRGEWPVDPPVGSLTVRCGDRVLARIAPVQTAH